MKRLLSLAALTGAVVLIVALSFLAGRGGDPAEASHGPAATEVAVDTDITGNTTSALGATDFCLAMANGGSAQVDIIIRNTDDLVAWQADFTYSETIINITGRAYGILPTELGDDPTTDSPTDADAIPEGQDGSLLLAGLTFGTGVNGSGYLVRLNISAVGPGVATLNLNNVLLADGTGAQGDTDGDGTYDGPVLNGTVAVDTTCGVGPTPPPTAPPTPPVTASPTAPPTASPTAPPVTASPTAPPVTASPTAPPVTASPTPSPTRAPTPTPTQAPIVLPPTGDAGSSSGAPLLAIALMTIAVVLGGTMGVSAWKRLRQP
jgi:cell division septation protein DedD